MSEELAGGDHWVYFPEEEYCFHRVSFPMNFSPNMVPNGTSSVAAEVPYRPGEPVDRSALTGRVLDDLVGSGILTKSDRILVTGTLVLDPAYVVYDLDHRRSVDAVHSYLLSNKVWPCGRFGEWEYLNMDHALLSGKTAARRVLETMGQQLAAE